MGIYKIHEDNLERLESKLNTIEKKCAKLGCSYTYRRLGEVYEEVESCTGRKYIAKFIEVEVTGKAKVEGWQVIAKIEHTPNGVVIFKFTNEVDIPEKYKSGDYKVCEHCKSTRNRKVLYVLKNNRNNKWKQVGASCLAEFTRGLDAEYAANFVSIFDTLSKFDFEVPQKTVKKYYPLTAYLSYCVECISKFGWTRSGQGYSTADRAWEYFLLKEYGISYLIEFKDTVEAQMNAVDFKAMTPENIAQATSILNFIRHMEADSDYTISLKSIFSSDYFLTKYRNFVASSVKYFQSYLKLSQDKSNLSDANRQESKSSHIGNIGDKITCKISDISCLSSWDGAYGKMVMYKIIDDSGNVIIWETSKILDLSDLSLYNEVSFVVKSHSEFREVLQTEVMRCKFSK